MTYDSPRISILVLLTCLLTFILQPDETNAQAMLSENILATVLIAGTDDVISLKKLPTPEATETSENPETGEDDLGFQFTMNGFVELENFVNTYTKQEPSDVNKKNEIRVKLSMQAGTENNYFKCDPNFYFLPYFLHNGLYSDYKYNDKNFNIARNGRISGNAYEMSLNECFLNIGFDNLRFRIGNQIYAWGTADLFNPTSYINPSDTRELFYKDSDEGTVGVPSVSSMIHFSDFSLELVFVPVHIGSISPAENNFWMYQYNLGFVSVTGNEDKYLKPAWENAGYGGRLARSIKGVDLSLSCYHGPDTSPLLRPMKYLAVQSDVLVEQEYHTSTNIGFDFSFQVSKFEIHGEMAYSPDKYGVVDEAYDLEKNPELLKSPFRVKSANWLSYAVGLNFTQDKLIITAEWIQSNYFDNSLMKPFYTDFIASSISYSFFDEFLNLSMAAVYDTKNVGYLVMPAVSLDFESGVSLRLAYGHIGSKETDDINIFTLYEKKDIIKLGLRYVF